MRFLFQDFINLNTDSADNSISDFSITFMYRIDNVIQKFSLTY